MRACLFCLWVLCVAGACVKNPVTHNSELVLTSESGEIAMGRDVDRYLVATRRFYDDSAWEGYVQRLGLRLVAKCERPGLPWTFRVLDDPSVNAFALPGGFVYVTRGMLVYLSSEAQLAAVLGHEIGHVAARHAVGQRTRQQVAGLGVLVAAVASSTAGYAGAAGMQVLLLTNSRHDEEQADDLGLHYMTEAGYDPLEMVAALRIVESAVGVEGPLPAWRATHPGWDQRVANIKLERFNLRTTGTLVEREPYLAHLDGLAFGFDQRQGYFKGRRFIVPARGYQLTFPFGWTLSSDGPAVRAESPEQDASIELTTTNEPTADSAARYFFAKLAKSAGPSTAISAPFSWLPLWVKMRGSVTFIEHRGTVYRVVGYAKNGRWSAYRDVIEDALRTFASVPSAEIERTQPLRVATFSLAEPTSLAALVHARPAPVTPAELALMNQVPSDSLLPAGRRVKWVVGTAWH